MTLYKIREITDLAGWSQLSDLYIRAFGYRQDFGGISPRLLAALASNGGSVIGAFDAQDYLRGFAYGFCGFDGKEVYHYSQATVVDPELQGSGIGRKLKHAQALSVRRLGVRTMRWTFDPLLIKNAKFNFNILGAIGISIEPNIYGEIGTDRITASWNLDWAVAQIVDNTVHELPGRHDQVVNIIAQASKEYELFKSKNIIDDSEENWGAQYIDNNIAYLLIPSLNLVEKKAKQNNSDSKNFIEKYVMEVRELIFGRLTSLIGQGYVLVSANVYEEVAVYVAIKGSHLSDYFLHPDLKPDLLQ